MSPPPAPAEPGPVSPEPTDEWSAGRRTLLLGAAVALAIVFGAVLASVLADGGGNAPAPANSSSLGPVSGTDDTPLPAMRLAGFFDEDEVVDLADYRGRPLVVNYWATWCAPCVEEMPDLQDVAATTADAAFLGVNLQDDAEDARAFVAELGVTYDLASDPDGESFSAISGIGMPTTLFVDVDGVIVYRHTGILDADELRGLLAEHLGVSA